MTSLHAARSGAAAPPPAPRRLSSGARRGVLAVGILALVVAMALNTRVVRDGSAEDTRPRAFSAAEFGAAEFPAVKAAIEQRAVEAGVLASAIATDATAAAAEYGVRSGVGSVIPVKFAGVVTTGKSGVYTVTVEGVPEALVLRVQTGPAINGTELRDATGTIGFDRFTNQIEYQNAAAALNNELKTQVLSSLVGVDLVGKTITVVGAFTLINPKAWLVTPISVAVQ